ncbi:site-specific integrase [Pseudooceanicola sp.]|uniref:site-specific integrase n=1 Tax=Pseudooceanicola sp. TaxID=1914328 RepID=UPI00405845AE
MATVIRHYIASRRYRDLAPRTRDDYDKHIAYAKEKLGHLQPRNIERQHVIRWLDAWAAQETPHRANYRLRVLSILMEHAKDMGLLTKAEENPCKGVRQIKYARKEREPWPQTKVAAFRKAFAHGTRERTIFELCLGSGQRIGDVLRMRWSDIEDGGIRLKQGKTGKPLWVPLTPHLAAALEQAPRRHLTILSDADGPLSYRQAAWCMGEARKKIKAEAWDIHALRYTAAVELLLSGCNDDLIAAVTGQSPAMVRHYTRHVRQRARAVEAQKKRR